MTDDQAARLKRAIGNVLLAFHDWPEYEGTDVCRGERESSLEALNEITVEVFYPTPALSETQHQ